MDHRHHLRPKAWAQSTNPSSNSCISAYCNYQVGHIGTEIEWRDGEKSMTCILNELHCDEKINDKERGGRQNMRDSPHSYDTLYSHPYFWMPQHIPHTWSNAKGPVSSDYSPVDSISLHVRHIDVQYHWASRVIPIYPIPYWQWRFHHIHIPTVMDHDTYPYHNYRANVLPIPSLGPLNHYPTQVERMFCCNEYAIAFVVCYEPASSHGHDHSLLFEPIYHHLPLAFALMYHSQMRRLLHCCWYRW